MAKISNIKFNNLDKEQFEELFRDYYSELCSFAYNFMLDSDDSEEIVQDIFVNFWNNRKNINIKTSVKAYLYSSVRNACLNKKKHIKIREQYKEHNERELENNFIDVENEMDASELDIKIRKTIDKMPIKRREIFILSRYESLKYKEIAEKLNISIKTVENQMGSALKYLRKELSSYLLILLLLFLKM